MMKTLLVERRDNYFRGKDSGRIVFFLEAFLITMPDGQ